ncbi:MAG: hypothetical protein WCL34_10885 [Methylococcaceae bacterium]
MTDITDQIAQLNELLAKVQQQAGTPSAPTSAWSQPAPSTTALNIQGVGIPVSIQTPAGKVRCTFWLGAEHAATPTALMSALETMVNLGLPVDAWQQKEQNGNNWGGNNSNNGGYKKRW